MLSSKQRSYLSALASVQKAIVYVGKEGVSESLQRAFEQALEDHELVKVRFITFKEERKHLAGQLAQQSKAELVRLIGNTAIFYRPSEKPEIEHIILP
ncbi:MAG: YhbY family RNA-binding protein [Treponemataceae bacterium]|nr:YhbY family RNA-binding protein [Treponemataceae bacterium]